MPEGLRYRINLARDVNVIYEKQNTLKGKLVRLRIDKCRARTFHQSGGSR